MTNILNRHILIVDDDERMLRSLAKVLNNEGAVTACACWAGEAMEQLSDSRRRFDLIITDLHMPFVRASTILRMMTDLQAGANRSTSAADRTGSTPASPSVPIPIIVLTGFGNPEVREDCLRQGAAAVLEKPLDVACLIKAIENAFALQKTVAYT